MLEAYPDKIEIVPLAKPPKTLVSVPGSKSITNRALVLAAQARTFWPHDFCRIHGALASEDTNVMLDSRCRLGFNVFDSGATISVTSESKRRIPATEADLFVGNSGTTMRF